MARVSLPPIEELQKWSNSKVIEWLKQAGFDDCINIFYERNINGDEFSRLTEGQLFQWPDIPIKRKKSLIKCLCEIQAKDIGRNKGLRIAKVKDIINPIKPAKSPPAVPPPGYHTGMFESDNREEDGWDTDFDDDLDEDYEATDMKSQNPVQNNQISRPNEHLKQPENSSKKLPINQTTLPKNITLPDRTLPPPVSKSRFSEKSVSSMIPPREKPPFSEKKSLTEKPKPPDKPIPTERKSRPNLSQKPSASDKPRPPERPSVPPPRPPKIIPKPPEICKSSQNSDQENYEIPSSSSSFSETPSQDDQELYELIKGEEEISDDSTEKEIPFEPTKNNSKPNLPHPPQPGLSTKPRNPPLLPPPLPGKPSLPTRTVGKSFCDENGNTIEKKSFPDIKSISKIISKIEIKSPMQLPPAPLPPKTISEFSNKQEKALPPLPFYQASSDSLSSSESSDLQLPARPHDLKPSLASEIQRTIPVANRPLPPPPDQSNTEDLHKYPWYHGSIDREETAEKLNLLNEDGSFLVRNSRQRFNKDCPTPFSLSIFFQGKLFHLQIRERSDKKFALGTEKANEQAFVTVSELISYHQRFPILLAGGGKILQAAGQTCLTKYPLK